MDDKEITKALEDLVKVQKELLDSAEELLDGYQVLTVKLLDSYKQSVLLNIVFVGVIVVLEIILLSK